MSLTKQIQKIVSFLSVELASSPGTCKSQEQRFVEIKTVHWIGGEFPDCGKWWHKICLGIKFKAEEEKNRYSLICPNYECDIAEIYPIQQKLKPGQIYFRKQQHLCTYDLAGEC